MRLAVTLLLLPLAACAAHEAAPVPALAPAPVQAVAPALNYPQTMREDVVDTQFGVAVEDPYRWLENDVREDPRVRDWVTAQNQLTNAYLAALPARAAFKERMTDL
jgi:prolyl oligopeptidase